jgi:hypothetical protein
MMGTGFLQQWNKFMNKEQREAYYHNWRDYFP